jgi:drug/metabolite transporter (DMT)-like permease
VVLFPSVLAYVFRNRAVRDVGAARNGQLIHLTFVFGTLLSILLLDEYPYGLKLVGIALVAVGVTPAIGRGPGWLQL